MDDIYKLKNKDRELLELISNIILNSIDKNGTDILVGNFNKNTKNYNLSKNKEEFCKICDTGRICTEPDLYVGLTKYKMKNKEYFHIDITSLNNIIEEKEEKSNSNIDHNGIHEKNEETIKKDVGNKINITERQREIVKLINENPYIKYDEIKQILGISRGTICIDMKVLKNLKILERIGTSDGKWEINKTLINV